MRWRGFQWREGFWLGSGAFVLVLVLASLAPQPADAQSPVLSAEEQLVLEALNREREQRGLTRVAVSPTLQAAASWMADDLALRGDTLSHTDSLGRDIRARFSAFGYPSQSMIRENLAAGQRTGEAVVGAWMNSPGHRSNMLAAEARVVGIALTHRPGTTYEWYWVLAFGSVDDRSLDAQATVPLSPPVRLAAIQGEIPSAGVAVLLAAEETTIPSLIAALNAQGCGVLSLWITPAAGPITGYVVGAPDFVNRAFPSSIAAGAAFLTVCAR